MEVDLEESTNPEPLTIRVGFNKSGELVRVITLAEFFRRPKTELDVQSITFELVQGRLKAWQFLPDSIIERAAKELGLDLRSERSLGKLGNAAARSLSPYARRRQNARTSCRWRAKGKQQ